MALSVKGRRRRGMENMNNCLQRALSVVRENNPRCLMGLLLLKELKGDGEKNLRPCSASTDLDEENNVQHTRVQTGQVLQHEGLEDLTHKHTSNITVSMT